MTTTLKSTNAAVNPDDNIALADDVVASVHYPIVKLDVGTAGASVPVVGTLPVSGTVTTSPPANASTNVAQLGGAGVTLGAKASASSIPVVLASDEATLPVSIAGTVTTSDTHFPSALALADGTTNPVTIQIGANLLAWDATNSLWRRVQLDAATGTLKVDPGTVTVTGTVTANAGANLNTSLLALDSTVAKDATVAKLNVAQAAAVGANTGPMIQAESLTAAPSYTNATINPVTQTLAGALRVDASATTQPVSGTVTATQGGAPWSANVTQFGGSPVVTGAGASGAGVPRVTIANDLTLADGAVATLGATTDAAVFTDTAASMSARLRAMEQTLRDQFAATQRGFVMMHTIQKAQLDYQVMSNGSQFVCLPDVPSFLGAF